MVGKQTNLFQSVWTPTSLISCFESFQIQGANKRADEHSVFPFIDVMEQILHKYDIDAIGCMQTVLCTFAQHAMENVGKGNGTNAEKIFDGAAR